MSEPLNTRLSPSLPAPLLACILGGNSLINYGKDMSGLFKLVEVLPQTKIESLGCAAALCVAFESGPVDMPALSPFPSHPSLGSLQCNDIGDKGASALVAILKETKITHLECAAIPK